MRQSTEKRLRRKKTAPDSLAVQGEDLIRTKQILKSIRRLTKIGGWMWDLEADNITWTKEACLIHDFEPGEVLPGALRNIEQALQCYRPEDRSAVEAAFQRCANYGEPFDLELPFTSARGRCLWVRLTAEALIIEGKIKKVLGNIVDITELKQLHEKLEQNEQQFRSIANYAPDCEIWFGKDGKIRWINPQVVDLLGYTAEECSQMTGFPLTVTDEADRARMGQLFQEALQGSSYKDIECRVNCKNGQKKWISLAWQPIYDEKGNNIGHRTSAREITVRKQAEEKLKKVQNLLELNVLERTEELANYVEKLKEQENLLFAESGRLQDANTALRVLLENREKEKQEMELIFLDNLRELVFPYLEKLQKTPLAASQKEYVNTIAANLKDFSSLLLHKLKKIHTNFTPREIEVSHLVQNGKSAKEIALLLNCSQRAIEFHKNNIRRKLRITHKKTNLRAYLLSLTENAS